MRVALLMGSFNPVHNGHLSIAEYVLDKGLADQVWLVVSPQNPLKSSEELAPTEDRLKMVKLAVEGHNNIITCDIELSLPQPSYTINTIHKLKERYSYYDFTILAGSDIADTLDRWYKIDELRELVGFMIYPRSGTEATVSPEMTGAPRIEISSTSIREDLTKGIYRPTELPAAVHDHICANHLYNCRTISRYSLLIDSEPENYELYLERGQIYFRLNEFSLAINDFNKAYKLNPSCVEARELSSMADMIVNYSYTEIYNP